MLRYRVALHSLILMVGVVFSALETAADSPAGTPPQAPAVQPDSVLGLTEAKQCIARGDYAAAERQLRPLLESARAKYGRESLESARVGMFLLQVLATTRDANAEAVQLAEEVREIVARARGPESRPVALVSNMLGGICANLGRFEESQRAYERALAIFARPDLNDPAQVADIHFNLGDAMLHAGDYERALSLLETALTEYTEIFGAEELHAGVTWHYIAQVRVERGELGEARACLARAAPILEKVHGTDQVETAALWVSQALLFKTIGDRRAALERYARALPVFERKLPATSLDLAWAYEVGAEIHTAAGDLQQARRYMQRAFDIEVAQYGPDDPNLGVAFARLGGALHRTGDDTAAYPRLQRGLDILTGRRPQDPALASALLDMAEIRCDRGDTATARRLCLRSLAIRQGILGPTHPQVGFVQRVLCSVHRAAGRDAEAVEAALAGESIARVHLESTARFLPERLALDYARTRDSSLDLLLSCVARSPSPEARWQAWDAVVRGRALVLDEMAARHHASLASADDGVRALRDSLEAARARLAYLALAGPQDLARYEYRLGRTAQFNAAAGARERYERLIGDARREKERYEERLAGRVAGRRGAPADIGLAEVSDALPAHSALVAFVQYASVPIPGRSPAPTGATDRAGNASYLVFVLRAGDASPELIRLGTAARVDLLVAAWRKLVATNVDALNEGVESTCHERGVELRRAVWDPVARRLGKVQRVFLVPDGTVGLMSFGALPADGGGFLVEEDRLLHVLSTERELAAGTPAALGTGLLAYGNPDFDDETPRAASGRTDRGPMPGCVELATERFPPLPNAEQETREVAQLWAGLPRAKRGEILVRHGGEASETTFKREAPGHRVLHLATHGFFLDPSCDEQAGDSGRDRSRAPSVRAAESTQNPLVRSGLALAGANVRHRTDPTMEDGFLTAEEIAALDLSGVEWVVLSACDTGLGVVRPGEGVLGLRRGFAVAGVRALIMSLWKVDDAATRQWMGALYEARLVSRAGTAEAVQEASRRILRERREKGQSVHPATWGGFIATGRWD